MSPTMLTVAAGFNDIGGPEYLIPLRNPIIAIESSSRDLWIDLFEETPSGRNVVTRYRFGDTFHFSQALTLVRENSSWVRCRD